METIFWLLYAVIAIGVFGFIGASILRASRVVASWTNSRHQREIPELIPSGIALSDCLLGATAILTHVLAKHGVRAVDTAFVHYHAQLVLAARGLAPNQIARADGRLLHSHVQLGRIQQGITGLHIGVRP